MLTTSLETSIKSLLNLTIEKVAIYEGTSPGESPSTHDGTATGTALSSPTTFLPRITVEVSTTAHDEGSVPGEGQAVADIVVVSSAATGTRADHVTLCDGVQGALSDEWPTVENALMAIDSTIHIDRVMRSESPIVIEKNGHVWETTIQYLITANLA